MKRFMVLVRLFCKWNIVKLLYNLKIELYDSDSLLTAAKYVHVIMNYCDKC